MNIADVQQGVVTWFLITTLSTALYYLGSKAQITRAIWSRYPDWLDNFMLCSACFGTWAGFALGAAFGLWQHLPLLGLPGGHPATVVAAGLCTMVWTPVFADRMAGALERMHKRNYAEPEVAAEPTETPAPVSTPAKAGTTTVRPSFSVDVTEYESGQEPDAASEMASAVGEVETFISPKTSSTTDASVPVPMVEPPVVDGTNDISAALLTGLISSCDGNPYAHAALSAGDKCPYCDFVLPTPPEPAKPKRKRTKRGD